jgi:hypothetical protein
VTVAVFQRIEGENMPALLHQVTEEMGVIDDPPEGLIVHVTIVRDGAAEAVDVWESRQQFDSFVEQRLMPAFGKVAERNGLDPQAFAGGPGPDVYDAEDLVRGR